MSSYDFCLITHKIHGGGAEVAVKRLAKALQQEGFSVAIFCLKNPEDKRSISGVSVFSPRNIRFRPAYFCVVIFFLLKVVAARKPRSFKLVCFQTDLNILVIFMRLISASKAKVYVCERSDPVQFPVNSFLRSLRFVFYRFAHRIICQTNHAAFFFGKMLPRSEDRIFTCKNILDTHSSSVQARSAPGRDEIKLACVGRLTKEKCTRDAIDFVLISQSLGYPCSLDIIGSGDEYTDLQNYIVSKDVTLSVRLCGHRNLGPSSFLPYDVLLHPSRLEGMANSVLEAMIEGIPAVISSNCRPMQEVVTDSLNGFVLEDFNSEMEVCRVLEMVSNAGTYEVVSKAAALSAKPYSRDLAIKEWLVAICD